MSKTGHTAGVQVPVESITAGPRVQWKHTDGPLLSWAGLMHWLSWKERFALWTGHTTIDAIACARWPHLPAARAALSKAQPENGATP